MEKLRISIDCQIWQLALAAITGSALLFGYPFCGIVKASAQELPAIPLAVRWEAPTKNEDGSCLKGAALDCSNDLAGYRIYRSDSEFDETPPALALYADVPASDNMYIDRSVTIGRRYHYRVTSIDMSGNESGQLQSIEAEGLAPASDEDQDSIANGLDNCPLTSNSDQSDSDGNGLGDACDLSGPIENNCIKDFDGDAVCDLNDNCPRLFNPNQADANGDGIGDLCALTSSRIACQYDKTKPLSAIALMSNLQVYLVASDSTSLATAPIASVKNGVVADFDSGSDGPEGFGPLEIMQAVAAPDAQQICQISRSSGMESQACGYTGDDVIGCYIDGDNQVDVVTINKREINFNLSSGQHLEPTSLAGLGRVHQVTCGDTDGDGQDEIAVLHSTKKGTRPGKESLRSISVLSSTRGRVVKTTAADSKAAKLIVADLKGNGKGVPCTLSKVSGRASAIACTKGLRRLVVPNATDFSSGVFDPRSRRESFVILGRDSKLSTISAKGKLAALKNSAAVSIAKEAKAAKQKLRFAHCR